MSDELLKKLQSRRSFLKGSALLAASVMAVPAALSAQSQDQQPSPDQKPRGQEGQERRDGQERQDGQDGQEQDKPQDAPQQEVKQGDTEKTFIGADGRPFRVCPQCGSNMYKQGKTWTCENCGYSYDE